MNHSASDIDFYPGLEEGYVLASCGQDKLVKIWKIEDTSKISYFAEKEFTKAIAYSKDRNYVAVADEYNYQIKILDLTKNRQVLLIIPDRVDRSQAIVNSLDFSPDSQHLIVTRSGSYFESWRLDYETQTSTLLFNHKYCGIGNVICCHPVKPIVAISGNGNSIALVDYTSAQEIDKIIQDQRVTSLKFSPDGKKLFIGTYDGKILIWNMESQDRVLKSMIHYS